jgi:hypothetical protein
MSESYIITLGRFLISLWVKIESAKELIFPNSSLIFEELEKLV